MVLIKLLRSLRNFYLRRRGVTIERDVFISLGAKIDVRRGKVIIKKNSSITWGSIILSHSAVGGRVKPNIPSARKTIIGEGAFIGVNSVILPGIKIGNRSIVGAGSVVTKDVPQFTVVAGNPARIISKL